MLLKRSAENKIKFYNDKIRKLQKTSIHTRRRRIIYSDSSDSEEQLESGTRSDCHPTRARSPTLQPPVSPSPTPAISPQASPPHALFPVPPTRSVSPPARSASPPATSTSPQPAPLPSPSHEEEELDPELLAALGDAADDVPTFGPDIHPKLAQRWLPILMKGLQSDVKDKLLKEYQIPQNCKLLKAPILNPEIAAALPDFSKARDKKLLMKQEQLGQGITAINRAMSLLLTTEEKIKPLQLLSDGCRILADLHYVETAARTKLITPCLDKAILATLQDHNRDETLFGNSLPEKIKASRAIEKQGQQIRKPAPPKATPSSSSAPSASRQRGNWSGPPRHQPQSARGGRIHPYRSQYRRGPSTALTTPASTLAPSHSRPATTSTASSKRAPNH